MGTFMKREGKPGKRGQGLKERRLEEMEGREGISERAVDERRILKVGRSFVLLVIFHFL